MNNHSSSSLKGGREVKGRLYFVRLKAASCSQWTLIWYEGLVELNSSDKLTI